MFTFEELQKEAKDRFFMDRFWATVFWSILFYNWKCIVVLASSAEYTTKISEVRALLQNDIYPAIGIGIGIAVFRVLGWPWFSKSIEFFQLKIFESSERKKAIYLKKGIIDARHLIVAIESFQDRKAHLKSTIGELKAHAKTLQDTSLDSLIDVLEIHNSDIMPGSESRCRELGISHDEINILTALLNGSIEGTARPVKRRMEELWQAFEENMKKSLEIKAGK